MRLGTCPARIETVGRGKVSILAESILHSKRELTSASSHETRNCGCRNKLDEPSQPKESNAEHDHSRDESEGGGDFRRGVDISTSLRLDMADNFSHLKRHDGDRSDRHIFGCGEEGVDHHTDEGRVETVLGVESGDFRVTAERWKVSFQLFERTGEDGPPKRSAQLPAGRLTRETGSGREGKLIFYIPHRLRDDDDADRKACDQITEKPAKRREMG